LGDDESSVSVDQCRISSAVMLINGVRSSNSTSFAVDQRWLSAALALASRSAR
jgi:hypothetical protein